MWSCIKWVHFIIYHLVHQSAIVVAYDVLKQWLEYSGTQKKSPANKRHSTSQQPYIYAGTDDSSDENIDYRKTYRQTENMKEYRGTYLLFEGCFILHTVEHMNHFNSKKPNGQSGIYSRYSLYSRSEFAKN